MSDKIRETFETWWRTTMNTQTMDLYRFGDGYACHETNRCWMAWQAALAQQPAGPGVITTERGVWKCTNGRRVPAAIW